MNHVLHARPYLHCLDVTGNAGGKSDFAAVALGAVFRHEQAAATSDAFQGAEKASASTELGMGRQLDGAGHPRKFAGFGNDGFAGFQDKLQDGQGGTNDTALHRLTLLESLALSLLEFSSAGGSCRDRKCDSPACVQNAKGGRR